MASVKRAKMQKYLMLKKAGEQRVTEGIFDLSLFTADCAEKNAAQADEHNELLK